MKQLKFIFAFTALLVFSGGLQASERATVVTLTSSQEISQTVNETVITDKKLDRKERKALRKALRKDRLSDDTLLLVIIAIFIPPLAVFLVDGLSTPFWIDLLLTLLFWLPGFIYALIRIL